MTGARSETGYKGKILP